ALVFVELSLRGGALRGILLLLEQAFALRLKLAPALLDGSGAALALLARLLERGPQLFELGGARRIALGLQLLAQLAQRLLGVVEALVRERLRRLAREETLRALSRHSLQALLERAL